MKKDAVLTLWVLSFIAIVVLAENPYNISFWISLGIFGYLSVYIEKHNKRFEHEDE
ncbi:hypothetical protein BACCAC_02346 [Bacteroides caccae ATCC 43185]|nr:hypothetical protein BACCAC_02346 [Bacteroides caccae ATCC 43185]DAG14929.1 MAG TPA: Photosystem II reaction centre I protein (PSII 4.8 kDa protein) [Caudoviricetes sp.]DAK96399.1 MAG TPA: Photosystem II reaction centre I protein (PSII 4.8 kDa protein) [Caudoviricetes sp.]